jgi:hypothetical protein
MRKHRWLAIALILGVSWIGGSVEPAQAADDVWTASYWNNSDLSGSPEFTREELDVENDWGPDSPASGINANNFSVRWTRRVFFDSGTYRFRASSDDGIRVWIDDDLIIDEWTDHAGETTVVELELDSGEYDLEVEYHEFSGDALVHFWWDKVGGGSSGATPTSSFPFDYWSAVYFNNTDVSGSSAASRNENSINHDWGNGSPLSGVNSDHFSVRWTRRVHFDTGTYRFTATSDDGIRVWVDDTLIIDEWFEHPLSTVSADLFLDNGDYNLEVEYFDAVLSAVVRLDWAKVTGPAPAPEPSSPTTTGEYVVQSGDSLGKIARIQGTTVQALINMNSGTYPSLTSNPDLIRPGWVCTLSSVATAWARFRA